MSDPPGNLVPFVLPGTIPESPSQKPGAPGCQVFLVFLTVLPVASNSCYPSVFPTPDTSSPWRAGPRWDSSLGPSIAWHLGGRGRAKIQTLAARLCSHPLTQATTVSPPNPLQVREYREPIPSFIQGLQNPEYILLFQHISFQTLNFHCRHMATFRFHKIYCCRHTVMYPFCCKHTLKSFLDNRIKYWCLNLNELT